MRLYRVHFYSQSTGSCGYAWFSSRAAAERAASKYVREHQPEPETGDAYRDMYRRRDASERPGIEAVTFARTKRGLLDLLDAYAGHPNNG